ncbi:unnamed protein product [Closterium sp. Yama58-4]|nr:unnamed protein product [Closterium sp. Yama58-4]
MPHPLYDDWLVLTKRDAETLQPRRWVSGEVIEWFGLMLQYVNKYEEFSWLYCSTYTLSLISMPRRPGEGFPVLAHENMLLFKWVLIPLHADNHWSLVILDNDRSPTLPRRPTRILHADSLSMHTNFEAPLREYLRQQLRELMPNVVSEADADDWISRVPLVKVQATQQTDACNCGVFVMKYMQYVVLSRFRFADRIHLHGDAEWWWEELLEDLLEWTVYYNRRMPSYLSSTAPIS